MSTLSRAGWALFLFLSGQFALGQQETAVYKPALDQPSFLADVSTNLWFQYGRSEVNLSSGVMFSPVIALGHRPTINYTMTEIQYGYMLSDVHGEGFWRGNFELLGELLGNWIFVGEGSYIAGGTLWGRYNFVQPQSRVLPFVQGGLGMVTTDISHKIDGQPFNFNLEIGVGMRYLLDDRWTFNMEFRYQHISNANTGKHNLGVNAFGPIFGVSYLF